MIEPQSSRLRLRPTGAGIQRNLPTGKNFGGSNLSIIQPEKLVFSIVTDTVSGSDNTTIGSIPQSGGHANEQQSPLVVEAGKLLVVAVWFWCLIGADFCLDSVSTIVRYCMQDV